MAKGEGLSPEIEKYDAMWRKDPKSRVFAQLADAYRKSGLFDEAIMVCEEGLKIHPQYASAKVVLGRTYLEKGEREKGILQLEEALVLSPDNLLSLKTLGELYQEEGKYRDALEKFKKAFLLNPLDRQIQGKIEEVKALMAAPSPPPLAPLTTKTDLPSALAAPSPPAAPAPAVPLKEEPSPEPAPLSSLPTEPLPPSSPVITASAEPRPGGTPDTSEAQPFMFVEETAGEEELSLSLEDLEEEETAPPPSEEIRPQILQELPFSEVSETPPITVEEVPLERTDLDVLTTTTLGDLYLEQGFWDRAVEIYQKVLDVDPKNPQALAKLAEALARKSGVEAAGAEPVYVIPEELVPVEGAAAGARLGELPLDMKDIEVQETVLGEDMVPLTPPPGPELSPELPPESLPEPPSLPTVLFPPEALALEVQELPPLVEAEEITKTPPPPKAAAAPPVIGDTTLAALEKLLTGVKREQERRGAVGNGR